MMQQEYTVRSTRTRKRSAARRTADVIAVLLICAALVVLIFKVILVPMSVHGSSVSELEDGELILLDRFTRYITEYAVGDIVRAETAAGDGLYRVAAKGGSRYLVRDGKAYIDGAYIDESGYSAGWPEDTELSFTVPEDEVLLLPDSREGVRSLSGWTVPYNDIGGEVRFRISPLGRLAFFY